LTAAPSGDILWSRQVQVGTAMTIKQGARRIMSTASSGDNSTVSASVMRWEDRPVDHPMPLIDRRRIIGTHMMISQVHLHKGFVVATHHHANEQFAWVMAGRVRFGVGAEASPERREFTLTAGQVLHLPPNVPHSAEALEDSTVIDLFSPPSEKTGVDAHGR
jgi:quercetin dioxygenase-like cupin family protein